MPTPTDSRTTSRRSASTRTRRSSGWARGIPGRSPPLGDNRNLLDPGSADLTDLQTEQLNFSFGLYNFTGTFSDFYDELVTYVGNTRSAAEVNLSVASSKATSAENRRDQSAAVSIDEEFSNLIRFQRAFEAAARMIKVADELLQEIVNLV